MTPWNKERIQRRLAHLVMVMTMLFRPPRDVEVAGLLVQAVWLAWQADDANHDTLYLDRLLDAVQPVMENMVLEFAESPGDLPVDR